MKIVHITDCYLPQVGGIELHIRDLAAGQRAQGHDVIVATSTPAGEARPGSIATDLGEEIVRVGSRDRHWLDSIDADVVHVHLSVLSPFALRMARYAATLGLPTVITVHSLWSDLARAAIVLRPLSGASAWPVVWTAVSEQAAVHVRRLVGAPVSVVPNAVDLDYWRPVAVAAAASAAAREGRAAEAPALASGSVSGAGSATSGRPTVLGVMRLTTVKRTLPLARMLHRVAREADFDAVIVGDGPKRAALERYLQRHHLDDRVTVTGALTREQVREQMATASIFIAPAWRESFGIAALEARTAGLPVLASSISGVATFITHEVDGLLADSDAAMARQLTRLVTDHALREQIATHNRDVVPDYGWEAALRTNAAAYRTAAAWSSRVGGLALAPVRPVSTGMVA
ncbi:glycosyltransferase family 4 protein [Nocardioides sp.]|uniref:glycosyltransferase family 4 protein n=1 Tax=Nocardioides sp. TaxID=35761 RepID=UPI0026354490|nr:glycosyltransferase family 4 protein [Nocardioides sp.]